MRRFAVTVLFGMIACGGEETRITGHVWAGDQPLEGATVYVSIDLDPTISGLDPVAVTDASGAYELVVPDGGTYEVRSVLPFGFRVADGARRAPIVGGDDAHPGDFGFMVALGFRFEDSVFQFCGGSLITDRHVVTAAHCSVGITPPDVAVVVGATDPFVDGQAFDVEHIEVFPDFAGAENGDDIAVWTLAQPVSLDRATTLDMLGEADATALDAPGTLATTIGWGTSDRPSTLLQQVHVPLVADADCAKAYPDSSRLDTQVCAGALEGGIDSCQGDSGGPLLVRDPARDAWVLAGITSYGEGCALPATPGVYARARALSAWAYRKASERGGSAQVTVGGGATATVDFPTVATTKPQVGAIAPRWQATGIALPGTVAADTPLATRWSILSDAPDLTGFTCHFEPDLAAAQGAMDVPCGIGTTELALPGYPTGIFGTKLTVSRADQTYTRRVNVFAGTLTPTEVSGALERQDPLDPDYASFGSYHVDYYEVTGLAGTRAFAVDASGSGFTMFLTLYDLDKRDFVTGGGVLDFAGTLPDGRQRLIVIPEPGRRYLIGVSSLEANATGHYLLEILNDGALSAR